jgi:hypothetical protein
VYNINSEDTYDTMMIYKANKKDCGNDINRFIALYTIFVDIHFKDRSMSKYDCFVDCKEITIDYLVLLTKQNFVWNDIVINTESKFKKMYHMKIPLNKNIIFVEGNYNFYVFDF